jgi:anti-sigma-K factor RskA
MQLAEITRAAAESTRFWRRATAVAAVFAAAFLVAALIARPAADFSSSPVVGVIRDNEEHPIWAIRLARASHQIAVDTLRPTPAPAGKVFQLWLSVGGETTPRWLALLPPSGRKPVAVTPQNARLLNHAGGELVVTLEPAGGAIRPQPGGPAVFRGDLSGPS